MQRPARTQPRGFTLIEMVVVIFIIAIVSSVVVPAYSHMVAKARFQKSVQEVVGLLTWARNAAKQAGADSSVKFDAQSGAFAVTVESAGQVADVPTALQQTQTQEGTETQNTRTYKLDEEAIITNFTMYNGGVQETTQSQTSMPNEIRFHEDGSSNGGQFVMTGIDGHSVGINISPLTGRVETIDTNGP